MIEPDEAKRMQHAIDGETIKQIAEYHGDTVRETVAVLNAIDAKVSSARKEIEESDGDVTREVSWTASLADVCEWSHHYERLQDDLERIKGDSDA